MFCTNCGSKLTEGAKFCASCGAKTVTNEVDPIEEVLLGLNPQWLKPAIDLLKKSIESQKIYADIFGQFKSVKFDFYVIDTDEYLVFLDLSGGSGKPKEVNALGEKILALLSGTLLAYMKKNGDEQSVESLENSLIDLIVRLDGQQVYSSQWGREELDADNSDDDLDENEESVGESAVFKPIDSTFFESYENKIIEKGLITDLINKSGYDVSLRLEQYENSAYKLIINIGLDEAISLSDEEKEAVSDAIGDYLRDKGAYDDAGINAEQVDWIVVTVNGGEHMEETFAERIDEIVENFKADPRNKLHIDEQTLLLCAREETGMPVSVHELRQAIEAYLSGDLEDDAQTVYDGAVYACSVGANQCFGDDPDAEIDYEISWDQNDDGSYLAVVRQN